MFRALFHLSFPSRVFFFFNDTATTEIYTLSLHDALPIYPFYGSFGTPPVLAKLIELGNLGQKAKKGRSEEHTSELQSHSDLVCRLLLEKKKTSLLTRPRLVTVTRRTRFTIATAFMGHLSV